jgi:CRISPR-associated endonuclease/helicase Cas3
VLSDAVATAHDGAGPTLVILNRVARAQELFDRLRNRMARDRPGTEVVLVHSRFRAAERSALNARLRALKPDDAVIVVATQAVEAGVDITSRRLFTELAPWSSLVQRFGRCNRGGDYDDAAVQWIDIGDDAQLALPYDVAALNEAREVLRTLASASSAELPPVEEAHTPQHVLRRKDLLDLFNTEPDLSGFDIDISPFLRDAGGADVQVFWRDFGETPDQEARPGRAELCAVPIGAARDHLRSLKRLVYVWNSLDAKWDRVQHADLRPGQVLMVHSDTGGYDPERGFVAGLRTTVDPIPPAVPVAPPPSMDDDANVAAARYVELSEHLLDARREAAALAEALPMAGAEQAVIRAALWHDTGKAHPVFQTAILEHASADVDRSRLWAKSADSRRRLNYGILVGGELKRRSHFRHELASMLAWLAAGDPDGDGSTVGGEADLIAYLIAAHHGKVRTVLRALTKETSPPDDRPYVRGVWAGDALPAVAVNGLSVPGFSVRLDLMEVGEGDSGPSWSARTAALLDRWGPFRLAWLESMVRIADWRASEESDATTDS